MPREKDAFWEFVEIEGGKLRCKFCNEQFKATITRMKYHLARLERNEVRLCTGVTDEVCDLAVKAINELEGKNKKQKLNEANKSSVGSTSVSQSQVQSGSISSFLKEGNEGFQQPKIQLFIKKREKEHADMKIMSMIVSNNLSFNLLRSIEFKEAMVAVANHGPGYVTPSYETARTKLLASLKGQTEEYVKKVKESWATTGCTIMSDSWTDARKRPHINLLVSCPKGTIFLKSECTVGRKKDASFIADFISTGIEEIGPENVVQFISDNASNYVSAGYIVEAKFPHIFKTSCAAHCLDLILEQIDELEDVKPILTNARTIVKFLYKFQHVLDLMRVHTQGRELKRPGATRFATQFLCLQSILREEQPLRNMVASSEWRALPQSRSEDGKEIINIIQGSHFWEKGQEILRSVEPLVRVLRMADGDGSTLCYLYEAMDRAKESIKKTLNNEPLKFMPYWDIIDKRWAETLDNPLHAFSAYLNPYLFYHKLVKMDLEVKNTIDKVKEKMVLEEDKKKFTLELKRYHTRDPKIFVGSAIDLLDSAAPSK